MDERVSGAQQGCPASPPGAPRALADTCSWCELWHRPMLPCPPPPALPPQGVHSSLMRLRGALGDPTALPRRAAIGALRQIERAASARQQLQLFCAPPATSGAALLGLTPADDLSSSLGSSSPKQQPARADPVREAFGSGVARVLREQSAALQDLERRHSVEWQETVGEAGVRLAGRGLTPVQAALHTRG